MGLYLFKSRSSDILFSLSPLEQRRLERDFTILSFLFEIHAVLSDTPLSFKSEILQYLGAQRTEESHQCISVTPTWCLRGFPPSLADSVAVLLVSKGYLQTWKASALLGDGCTRIQLYGLVLKKEKDLNQKNMALSELE